MSFRLAVKPGKDRIGTVGAAYGPDRKVGKHVSRIEVMYRRVQLVAMSVEWPVNCRTC